MADLGDRRFVNRVLTDLYEDIWLLSYQCFSLKQDTQSWMIVIWTGNININFTL
jgi:hypothetical protein